MDADAFLFVPVANHIKIKLMLSGLSSCEQSQSTNADAVLFILVPKQRKSFCCPVCRLVMEGPEYIYWYL